MEVPAFPRRIPVLPAALGVAAVALLGYAAAHPTSTVVVPVEALRRTAAAALPLSGARDGISYEIASPEASVSQDGLVVVRAHASAAVPGRSADAAVEVRARLSHDGAAFRLQSPAPGPWRALAVDPALGADEAPRGGLASVVDGLGLRDREARAVSDAGGGPGRFLVASREAAAGDAAAKGAAMLASALGGLAVQGVAGTPGLELRAVRAAGAGLEADLNDLSPGTRGFLLAAGLTLAVGSGASSLPWLPRRALDAAGRLTRRVRPRVPKGT